jgi:hypothetical protein
MCSSRVWCLWPPLNATDSINRITFSYCVTLMLYVADIPGWIYETLE